MFSLCLLDLQYTIPYPNYMQPPVWIFKSVCTPYAASNHVYSCIRLSYPMIRWSFIVFFRYCTTCLDFYLSSLVTLVTLLHRNDIAWSMSGLHIFLTKVVFQIYSVLCPHLYFLALWNSYLCSVVPSLMVMTHLRLAPLRTNKMIPQCNPSWIKIIFHSLRTKYPLPGTCVSYPLILWCYQMFWLLFQLFLCLLFHQRMMTCCHQHTMIFCISCL